MEYGIVYLLTNPVMPGLVKNRYDHTGRHRQTYEGIIYNRSSRTDLSVNLRARLEKVTVSKLKKALHKAFDPQRINQNREFFRINVEQAQAILELFHHEDVTEEVTDEIQNDLTDEDKAASTKAHAKRPPLNFYEMGLQKGDVLIWKDDPSISVTILSERKVCYQGEETSISALSAKLKGYKVKHIQPTPHWRFQRSSSK